MLFCLLQRGIIRFENLPGKAKWMNGWRKEGIEGGEKVGIRDSSFLLWWGGWVGGWVGVPGSNL